VSLFGQVASLEDRLILTRVRGAGKGSTSCRPPGSRATAGVTACASASDCCAA